jgi:methylamine---glutamate N-methyltransferase subunit B
MTRLARRQETEKHSHMFDLSRASVRELNQALHNLTNATSEAHWTIINPAGQHAIAAGLDAPIRVKVKGHAGYYCGGMNKHGTVIIEGNAGVGVAENMMSGFVHVKGSASQSAGASAHGGMLLIEGNASARCGISLKGADLIVKGSVGHLSAFMAQAGSLIVFGDVGENLGDSIYEAMLFVRGKVASLGSDCVEKDMTDASKNKLYTKLKAAGIAGEADISDFRRYGSARRLYHFHVDHAGEY